MAIVGDAFGKPHAQRPDAAPGRYDVSSLASIVSSGVMWCMEVKRRPAANTCPPSMLKDGFSSSEALGMGASVMRQGHGEAPTAKFMIGERCKVFDENDNPVEPGSGVPGIVAIGPPNPLGYYKDEAKTARTFRTIGGVRYSIPGDWCLVETDGSLTLLGRGSACINTAGEKVFPEEVEEALKTHPSVEDALVVGLPDEKWGQAVTGVVRLAEGCQLDEEALRAHVRQHLAGYKTPKRIVVTEGRPPRRQRQGRLSDGQEGRRGRPGGVGAARSKPLPPCGEGVGDGGISAAVTGFDETVELANHDRHRFTPTPNPSPQGGGELHSSPPRENAPALAAAICILLLAAVPLAADARSHGFGHSYSRHDSYRPTYHRDRASIFPRAERVYIPVEPLPLSVRCGYRLRDWRGRYIRCSAARAAFERDHPCPSTGEPRGACPGYVVDHIIPLKRGGADLPENMQWQTLDEARDKDKVE